MSLESAMFSKPPNMLPFIAGVPPRYWWSTENLTLSRMSFCIEQVECTEKAPVPCGPGKGAGRWKRF
mgnify:CR=1 FL=1